MFSENIEFVDHYWKKKNCIESSFTEIKNIPSYTQYYHVTWVWIADKGICRKLNEMKAWSVWFLYEKLILLSGSQIVRFIKR